MGGGDGGGQVEVAGGRFVAWLEEEHRTRDALRPREHHRSPAGGRRVVRTRSRSPQATGGGSTGQAPSVALCAAVVSWSCALLHPIGSAAGVVPVPRPS